MKIKFFALLVMILFSVSTVSAGVVANTATTLPSKSFSATGGIFSPLNSANSWRFFGIFGVGLSSDLDLALKYLADNYFGADFEYMILKKKEAINLSFALGGHYVYNGVSSSSTAGFDMTLLLSKSFSQFEPYIALDYDLNSPFKSANINSSLDFVVGVDIKLIKPLTIIIEGDFPVSNGSSNPTVLLGACIYLGTDGPF